MKSHKIKLILTLAIILIIFLTSLNICLSYMKIKRTVVDAIGQQSVEAAKSIASSMNTEAYQKFLLNPEENEHYWGIRHYLNDAKKN